MKFQIVDQFHGEFPRDLEVLINQMPGVGRYTAGAVTSIAFNQVRPVRHKRVNLMMTSDFYTILAKSNP